MSLWIDTTVMELVATGFFLTFVVIGCYILTPFKKRGEEHNDKTQ